MTIAAAAAATPEVLEASPPPPANPTLKRLFGELGGIYDAIRQERNVFTADALNRIPPGSSSDRWSAGQVFDHLNKTGTLFLPKFDAAIRQGRAANRLARNAEPPRFNFVERKFIQMMRPADNQPGNVPVPGIYRPAPNGNFTPAVVEEFLQLQRELQRVLCAADGLDLERTKAPSPVTPLLRLSLGAWFTAAVTHEQYHLTQIAALRSELAATG